MKVHFTENYLINPTHQVTVNLIGCGGTGSQVLSSLGRMDAGLRAIGHPGLHVVAYDHDKVSKANVGRQLFSSSDIGCNKATLLITRINRFYGLGWRGFPIKYNGGASNITISCVDSAEARMDIRSKLTKQIHKHGDYINQYYHLDFGNTKDSGQVVLGTLRDIKQPKSKKFETVASLPCVWDRFNLKDIDEKDSGPSCSLAEAIGKQDLFINSTLANLGCNLLWRLFRNIKTEHAGMYLNLNTMKVNPILV